MAFTGRLGFLVQNISSQRSSMLNAVRSVSSNKLFIGGLSYGTDDRSLETAFKEFGDVTEARVITDRDTGRSRGFGFVSFETGEAANNAMTKMDGKEVDGRCIRVSFANERSGGGGNFRNSGGYDNGYRNNNNRGFGGGDSDGGDFNRGF